MKKIFITFFFLLFYSEVFGSVKDNIIQNLKEINNISFNFEQNINGKTENGKCILQYPKKIYCNYNLANNKTLVSNGKSLVIKTKSSYYRYPLEKTPLELILDKNYLVNKIEILNEKIIDDKFINFSFIENDNEINVFFNKKNYNLVGWQTVDIYQNLSITYISGLIKNQILDQNKFILPNQN